MSTNISKMEARSDVKNRKDSVNKELELIEVVHVKDTTQEQKEGEIPDLQGDSSCFASFKEIRHKLKSNHKYQELIIYSICLYIGKFMQGWCQSLFGPSYIDIRMISGTDLAQGSWILASRFIGSTIGSTLQGALYGRINNKLTFGSALCGNCIIFAVIPWCALFEAMICAHVLLGIVHGIYVSGISVDVLKLWGKDSRVAFLGCQLLITLGSALSPLAAAPFLVGQEALDIVNVSSLTTIPTVDNFTNEYAFQNNQSDIYIPFSITAGMSIASGMFFLVLYLKYNRRHTKKEKKNPDVSQKSRKVPKSLKLFILIIFGLMLFIFAGVNEAFPGFLATYCVQYFVWTKKNGAFITFLFFLLNLISQIVGIAIEKWMNTMVYTVVNFILMFLSIVGIFIVSLYHWDSLVWFFVPLLGFSKGCLFAMLFSWTNDYILHVTGKISAFYYICLMTGGAINPILFGYVMENVGLIWFCYVLLIESIAMLILIAVIVVATRYVLKHFGRPLYLSQAIELKAINEVGQENHHT